MLALKNASCSDDKTTSCWDKRIISLAVRFSTNKIGIGEDSQLADLLKDFQWLSRQLYYPQVL